MPALDSALRKNLENTIVRARDAAERAAGAAIQALAVRERPPGMTLKTREDVDEYLEGLRISIIDHIDEERPVIL